MEMSANRLRNGMVAPRVGHVLSSLLDACVFATATAYEKRHAFVRVIDDRRSSSCNDRRWTTSCDLCADKIATNCARDVDEGVRHDHQEREREKERVSRFLHSSKVNVIRVIQQRELESTRSRARD